MLKKHLTARVTSKPICSQGFTLVEVLVAMAIIVVLMGIAVSGFKAIQNKSMENKANVQLKRLENGIEQFQLDNGYYPQGNGGEDSSKQLYRALYHDGLQDGTKVYVKELNPDSSSLFKIDNERILDPWKMPFYYLSGVDEDGNERGNSLNPDFDLWSLGPNKEGRGRGNDVKSRKDDVINW